MPDEARKEKKERMNRRQRVLMNYYKGEAAREAERKGEPFDPDEWEKQMRDRRKERRGAQ